MVMWPVIEDCHTNFYGTAFKRPVVCVTHIQRGVFILAILYTNTTIGSFIAIDFYGSLGGCGP